MVWGRPGGDSGIGGTSPRRKKPKVEKPAPMSAGSFVLGGGVTTKLVAPDMIQRGRGSIVAVASVLSLIATPHRSAYIAAKHALHGFFEALRTETLDQGLHVMLA